MVVLLYRRKGFTESDGELRHKWFTNPAQNAADSASMRRVLFSNKVLWTNWQSHGPFKAGFPGSNPGSITREARESIRFVTARYGFMVKPLLQ